MPLVSIVIPVLNAEPYLRECIDSLLAQTLSDFEIICVDDGSTDGSVAILKDYEQLDERISVISQENKGAGAARNIGIEIARGDYLLFLDADDFVETRLLEATYNQCVTDRADIAVYHTRNYDLRNGRYYPADWLLRSAMLPAVRPFSRHDMPTHILVFSSPAPWNKIYRRDFIVESGLRFQEIKRSNDLFFTKCAFVAAERITVVDEVLINYRIGSETNLQSANHETPLDFFEALLALRVELRRMGVLDEMAVSYANLALPTCIYNLNSITCPRTFIELYEMMRTSMFRDLGLLEHPREVFFYGRRYEQMQGILSMEPEEYLLHELLRTNIQCAVKARELKQLNTSIKSATAGLIAVKASRAYRVSRSIRKAVRRSRGRVDRKSAGVN